MGLEVIPVTSTTNKITVISKHSRIALSFLMSYLYILNKSLFSISLVKCLLKFKFFILFIMFAFSLPLLLKFHVNDYLIFLVSNHRLAIASLSYMAYQVKIVWYLNGEYVI